MGAGLAVKLMAGCLALLAMAGCDRHPPLSAAQAEALADAQVRKTGADWGRAKSVELGPGEGTRRFWIIRYAPTTDAATRAVAVNYRSGWTKFLAADDPQGLPPDTGSQTAMVLLLREQSRDQWNDALLQEWQTHVQEWNQVARESGGEAAYGLRQTAHSWQLLWGWNDGKGMRVDPPQRRVLHGRHPGAQWINLTDE